MKSIIFNEKYGLESAVLNGTKTRTWRADNPDGYAYEFEIVIS